MIFIHSITIPSICDLIGGSLKFTQWSFKFLNRIGCKVGYKFL